MYRITFYVPADHLEAVKLALFSAGAGKIGDYEHCAWQTAGHGQYKPLAGSQPFRGETDQLQQEQEYKVEMVCAKEHIKPVLQALLDAHPYETPAYEAYPILTLDQI